MPPGKCQTTKTPTKNKKPQTSVRNHKQVITGKKVTGPRPGAVKCDICRRYISRPSDLKRHKKTHQDKKEVGHKCPHPGCKHYSLQKSNLEIHMRQHSDEMPEECQYPPCQYKCKDASLLNRHMKVVHKHVPRRQIASRSSRTRITYASHASPTPSPPPPQLDTPEPMPQDKHPGNYAENTMAAHETYTSVAEQPSTSYLPSAAPVFPIAPQPTVYNGPIYLDAPQQVYPIARRAYYPQHELSVPPAPSTLGRVATGWGPSPAFSYNYNGTLQQEVSYPSSRSYASYNYNRTVANSNYGSLLGQGQYSCLRDLQSYANTTMPPMQNTVLDTSNTSVFNAGTMQVGCSHHASGSPLPFDSVRNEDMFPRRPNELGFYSY